MAANSDTVAQDPVDVLSNSLTNSSTSGLTNGLKEESSLGNGHVRNGDDALHEAENWIPIREEVLWKPTRKVRVVSIGAGFSGKNGRLFCQILEKSLTES